eukprot:gene6949-8290_t
MISVAIMNETFDGALEDEAPASPTAANQLRDRRQNSTTSLTIVNSMSELQSCSDDSMWPTSSANQDSEDGDSEAFKPEAQDRDVRSDDRNVPHSEGAAQGERSHPKRARLERGDKKGGPSTPQATLQAQTQNPKTDADDLDKALRTLREQSKQAACLEAVKISFDQRRFLYKVYEERYSSSVEASMRVISQVLFRAVHDLELPSELREVLPHIFLYPCYKTHIQSTEKETRVRLSICVGDLLRYKYLLLAYLHDREEAVAKKNYQEYHDRITDSNDETIPACFVRGRSHEDVAKRAAYDRHKVLGKLGKNLTIYTAGDVRKHVEFRIADDKNFKTYLTLHALANWFDCPSMVQRSTREFMGTLMAALTRYPDSVVAPSGSK